MPLNMILFEACLIKSKTNGLIDHDYDNCHVNDPLLVGDGNCDPDHNTKECHVRFFMLASLIL